MKQVALQMLTVSLDSDREPFHEESLYSFYVQFFYKKKLFWSFLK